tara:strand:- start:199 stop:624 length:426 start_codon:yes stop_codon:yes gene_type:complete
MEKKALLDYGTHPSFPAMTVPSTNLMNMESAQKASKWLVERKKEIEEEFEMKAKKLYDMAVSTTRVNESEKSFEPITAKLYFLYGRGDDTEFLSIIEPHQWTPSTQPYKYIGMFKLNSDGIWNNVTRSEFEQGDDWRLWGE